MPDLLRFRDSFEMCVSLLGIDTIQRMPAQVAEDVQRFLRQSVSHHLKPQFGIMVTLPSREKARSIEHCCQIAGRKTMSVERKYDGEYCQVHVELEKVGHRIKIFSKSGVSEGHTGWVNAVVFSPRTARCSPPCQTTRQPGSNNKIEWIRGRWWPCGLLAGQMGRS
jgi:hypothetical protein